MKTFFLRDVRAAGWGTALADPPVLREATRVRHQLPTHPSYLSALDALMQRNGGRIPELASPAAVAIAGHDLGQQPELTVGHVLAGAYQELSATARP